MTSRWEGIVSPVEASDATPAHLGGDNNPCHHTRIHCSYSWMGHDGHVSGRRNHRHQMAAGEAGGDDLMAFRSRRLRRTTSNHWSTEGEGGIANEGDEGRSSCVTCSMTIRQKGIVSLAEVSEAKAVHRGEDNSFSPRTKIHCCHSWMNHDSREGLRQTGVSQRSEQERLEGSES